MGKALVIVESPAKAKTINKYLGKDFIVKSVWATFATCQPPAPSPQIPRSGQRRRPLPEKWHLMKARYQARKKREQLVRRMGIDPDNGWQARYEILPGKRRWSAS